MPSSSPSPPPRTTGAAFEEEARAGEGLNLGVIPTGAEQRPLALADDVERAIAEKGMVTDWLSCNA